MTIYEKMNAVVLSNEKTLDTLIDTICSSEPYNKDELYSQVQTYKANLENDMDMITHILARNDDEISIANAFGNSIYCTLCNRYDRILKNS